MKVIHKIFKIDVLKKRYEKKKKTLLFILFLLVLSLCLFLRSLINDKILSLVFAIALFSDGLILLELNIQSSLVKNITDDEINMINNDFSNKNGLIFEN